MANKENKKATAVKAEKVQEAVAEETVKPAVQVAKASANNIGVSPRKIKLMIDIIRGKSVGDATAILNNTKSLSSVFVLKVVTSASANAVHNYQLDANKLYIKEIYVNPGRLLKRFRARAKGVGNRILKRSSQITVVVAESEK